MRYSISLSKRSRDTYDGLSYFLQDGVDEHLKRLAETPTSLGRPTVSPPYPPGHLAYEFDLRDPISGNLHHFAIFFRYGQDETTLYVYVIGHTDLLQEE